ncbi:hypothetical protein M2146_001096 [Lachnospiraceae bacterium PF1-22]
MRKRLSSTQRYEAWKISIVASLMEIGFEHEDAREIAQNYKGLYTEEKPPKTEAIVAKIMANNRNLSLLPDKHYMIYCKRIRKNPLSVSSSLCGDKNKGKKEACA